MIKKILLGLLAIILAVIIVASFQPNEFKVTRTLVMNATPQSVFEQVNDLKKMNSWSPWVKMEPTVKMTYEGPTAGVGAKYSWEGKETGAGSMTIIDVKPNEFVKTHLDFLKPFAGMGESEFVIRSEGKQTSVTWIMSGKNILIGKVFNLFINQDKMIGGAFEKGLVDLKTLLESSGK
ncbi:MAG: SRPBCC family protein [Xanthomonadaceae bacterium]|nr:SRPBCC family protein [Xanthomonadaceae bacterium]